MRVQERGALGRETILHFYTTSYKKELTRLATEQSKEAEKPTGEGIIPEQKKREITSDIRKLTRKLKQLSTQEIMFIIDLLISLCKHAQINEKNALSLGAHLLTDFKEQTGEKLQEVIKNTGE